MKQFLFAYGTLQPPKAPPEIRGVLKVLRPVGNAMAAGQLFDLGDYPGAVFDEQAKTTVKGMVFRLPGNSESSRRLLAEIDLYEGVNASDVPRSLFVRRKIRAVLRSGRDLDCWAYEYNRPVSQLNPIFDGLYIGPRQHRRTSSKRLQRQSRVIL